MVFFKCNMISGPAKSEKIKFVLKKGNLTVKPYADGQGCSKTLKRQGLLHRAAQNVKTKITLLE